jgi:hypothetical protein
MITKIQSFTDVITNSSSTVFVMSEFYADYYDKLENTEGCIDVEKIDMDWLKNNVYEFEMVCDLLDIDPSEVTVWGKHKYWQGWETPDQEMWETFLELHRNQIEEVFKDLYWVDIEDHFENAWDVTEEASDDAIWSDYRH